MHDLCSIYFDGGSAPTNPGNAYGSFLVRGQIVHTESRIAFGWGTNNQAEYWALMAALDWLDRSDMKKPKELLIFTDSMLVTKQLNGNWRARNHLKELRDQALGMLDWYAWKIHWNSRSVNVNLFGH